MKVESALVRKLNELPSGLAYEMLYDLIWFLYITDYILYSEENDKFYWESDGDDLI